MTAAYLAEIRGEPLVRSLRFGIAVVLSLNTAFVLVDVWVYPQLFLPLLAIRLLENLVLGVVYLRAPAWGGVRATNLGCLGAGAGLVAVISIAGGPASSYGPGLMLLFLGMPVLLPLTMRHAAAIVTPIFAAFALAPFLMGWSFEWKAYSLYLCFPFAAAVECIASTSVLNRLRLLDFRQRRELEAARDHLRELDRAKSRFMANVHHELRTPLTLLLPPVEAMLGGDFGALPARLRPVLETVQANGLRLLHLINDLLDLARIESAQMKIRRREVDLERAARQVVEGARPLAERKGLALEMEGFRELPRLYADEEALTKVLVNLVGNALKFTERGWIRLSARGEGDAAVHLVVADSGMGIPAEQLARIFDRFAQVESGATRRHEGTGIGLSLVQELVGLHGGRVWAESRGTGDGCQIHVSLPVGEADAEACEEVLESDGDAEEGGRARSARESLQALISADRRAQQAGRTADPRFAELEHSVGRWEAQRQPELGLELPDHPPGTPEVVVAEDNADMRRLLAFLIGREFAVRAVPDGKAALAAVREREPALVVTDVMMPELSGTALCRELKGNPETCGIPVMLVTSKAERHMKIEGLELGAEDYVTKPFHPRELLARVRSLVRVRQLQSEVAQQNRNLEQGNRELERTLKELKEAEVQLVQAERLAAVGELAAGVAHEVNNPLNFARNSLTTLRAYVADLQEVVQRVAELDPDDPRQLGRQLRELEHKKQELGYGDLVTGLSELVAIVTEGLDRTARLVGDLRDFASPHGDVRKKVDLVAGLSSTIRLMGPALRQCGAEVEWAFLPGGIDPEDGSPPRVEVIGDAAALNQVFLNLLKNAAQAIEGGKGSKIQVAVAWEGAEAVVRIRDEGVGMSPQTRARLFEPFFSTKPAGVGTGLGLSMCRRIVSQHGGHIEVESEEGAGTCVTVRLARGARGSAGEGAPGGAEA